jgi:hypothetical protein
MTIHFDAKIQRELDRLSRQLGRSHRDIVRDAVRRQVELYDLSSPAVCYYLSPKHRAFSPTRTCFASCREGFLDTNVWCLLRYSLCQKCFKSNESWR